MRPKKDSLTPCTEHYAAAVRCLKETHLNISHLRPIACVHIKYGPFERIYHLQTYHACPLPCPHRYQVNHVCMHAFTHLGVNREVGVDIQVNRLHGRVVHLSVV